MGVSKERICVWVAPLCKVVYHSARLCITPQGCVSLRKVVYIVVTNGIEVTLYLESSF